MSEKTEYKNRKPSRCEKCGHLKFKKKVEWDYSGSSRFIPLLFCVITVALFFSLSLTTLLGNHQTILDELELAKASIYSGLLSLFSLLISLIPKRKVYWEEVKNE